MPVIVKVLGFSLGLTLVFTLIANLLPQIEGEAPVDKIIDPSAFTEESFVALGEELFQGKGTCTLCHNNMGRAPDILTMDMVTTTTERLSDSRYQGKAADAESYLWESMLQPGIYVVKGFGKKGTNDTDSPMPAVDKAPIQLSKLEINAIIAFLQAKDGNTVTVALPTEKKEATPVITQPVAESTPVAQVAESQIAETAEIALVKFTCTVCHSVLETESPVGPDLRTVANRLSVEEIRQSIVEPNAVIADGFPPIMPLDFAEKMKVKELDMIVQFLAKEANIDL
ncbi:c-type cytochrome [Candidatus Parabeggiatoa sp. HSG14]|uniref:c-type cytochrome n=1 Tax=Candidatus Parabeggiatoa sp. HSG14 TaxID=3055593 RepID=UPI0025A69305|nr:hypothetical protein [Thiotrichales bacterium HSG14]